MLLVPVAGTGCRNPQAHALAEGVQSAGAGRRRSRALRDSTVSLVEKMNEMIRLTQTSSSICPWLHQDRLFAVSVWPQESRKVLHLCLQSLVLLERALVVGLDTGEAQGGALATQPGLCIQAVPPEAPRAAQTDLPFK